MPGVDEGGGRRPDLLGVDQDRAIEVLDPSGDEPGLAVPGFLGVPVLSCTITRSGSFPMTSAESKIALVVR